MKAIETIKEFVYNTLGHAISGAGIGVVYELQALFLQGGSWTPETVMFAIALGGSIGFFRTIVQELEKLSAKATATGKKPLRAYMGL